MTYVEYAVMTRALVGKPYILGYEENDYTDLDPEALDCSELVQYTYGRSGVKITDGAWLQYEATAPVDDQPVKIGDLVFLRNNPDRPNSIGHVAILVSTDGTIVEAKGRNYGVVYSTLALWKAKSTYAGRRRYAPFTAAMEPGGDTVFTIGSSGPDIENVQGMLAHLGIYQREPNGVYDAYMRDVVTAFQAAYGVPVNGTVDFWTIWRLQGVYGDAKQPAPQPTVDPLIVAKAAKYDDILGIVNRPS